MINASSELKKALKNTREFRIQDKITLKNGAVIPLSLQNLRKYQINEATSASGKFEIGAAVIKKYSATLDNMDGQYDSYDFEDADIQSIIGLKLSDGTYEDIKKGTYWIYKATFGDSTLQIEAYDEMLFFSKPYSDSTLTYPATIRKIIQSACRDCGVSFDASTIEMGDYRVDKKPTGNLTYRDVISYCAQIMGCYARIDHLGQLSFGWYDFPTVPDDLEDLDTTSIYHFEDLYSQSLNGSDINITGIKATIGDSDSEESYLQGTDTYALEIRDNPLIGSGTLKAIATHIGDKTIGKSFRPLNVSIQSDPTIEAGDAAIVTVRSHSYATVITETTFNMGGTQSIISTAETPTEKTFTRYSATTKLLEKARDQAEIILSDYDLAVQQMNQLAANTMGFYFTSVKQEDGSYLFYKHNKPKLSESKIVYKSGIDGFFVTQNYTGDDSTTEWKAGFDSDGNATLNQLAVIGIHWDWASGGQLTLGDTSNGNGVLHVYDGNDRLKIELSNGGQFLYDSNGKVMAIVNEDEILYLRGSAVLTSSWTSVKAICHDENGVYEKTGRVRKNSDNTVEWEEDDTFIEVDGVAESAQTYPAPFYKNNKGHWHSRLYKLSVTTDLNSKNEHFTNSPTIDNMTQNTDGQDVIWNGGKLSRRTSSSKRYKDVGEAISTSGLEEWYKITPVWAKYKEGYLPEDDSRYGKEFPMFLAEDIAEHFPLAADYLPDGRPETWNSFVMVPAMFAMIKEQHEEIEELKKILKEGDKNDHSYH